MFSTPPHTDASSFMLGPGPPIVTGDSERGPPGCNLFVFHLPNELTNWDLYLLFRKFGTIISVHTMINKNTGLSRGFGFVSFSKEDEAIAAVRAMDGFRLGKKRLKVQRKREHEEDDEGFGPDFDNFCGYSGFPSISIMADQMTPPSSSSSTPRFSSTPGSGIALSPISQPQTPQRFNAAMLSSPSAALSNRGMTAASMSCPIGRMSPIGSSQRGDGSFRSQGQGGLASCDITQETSHMRVSFEKECRLNDGAKSMLNDDFPEPFPGILSRTAGLPPQRGQSFTGAYSSQSQYDPRAGKSSIGIREGDSQFGLRSMGREGASASGLRGNLGVYTDMGRSAGLVGQSEEKGVGSPPIPFRDERVRDRRNSDDSFFYARRLGVLNDESPGGSTPSPGLSLPVTPRQSHLYYQPAYLQQQEERQQSPQLSDYDLEKREQWERSRSGSTTASHSTEGKTDHTDRTVERDVDPIDNLDHHNGLDHGIKGEDFTDEQQFRQQQYVYDESEGQYILR